MIDVDDDGGTQEHCHQVLEAMYLFLDREELTPDQRSHVQEHLDECIPCLEAFEFHAELKHVVAKRCRDEVPAHLYERVRLALSVELGEDCVGRGTRAEAEDVGERRSNDGGIPEG